MKQYGSALRGFIALRVGAPAAEDVSQETWTACWLALPNFAGKSRFKAWLYGIAVNKCLDYFRGRGYKEDSASHEIDEISSEDSALRQIVDRDEIRGALNRLPELQREVVELYYYAQLTLPEIAETVKLNLNTVKYQFYRAHDQIASEFQAD